MTSYILYPIFYILASVSSCSASEPIPIDKPGTFQGVVNRVTFPVHPAQNDPRWTADGTTTVFVLVMEDPRIFRGTGQAGDQAASDVTLQVVQLLPADEATMKTRIGQKVLIQATPEWAHSRYHRTSVLLVEKPAK